MDIKSIETTNKLIIKDTDYEYQKQFNKVKRWLKRLENFCIEKPDGDDFNDQLDFLDAFFTCCYHLGDYLKESQFFDKKEVVEYIESNLELKVCRDICNKAKHLKYRKPSIDSNLTAYKVFVGERNKLQPHLYHDWEIWFYDKETEICHKVNALELARKCVTLWKLFISERRKKEKFIQLLVKQKSIY